MAQLGDLVRAKALLRRAVRAFNPREAVARARCIVAEAEVALVSHDLGWPVKALDAARATLAGAVHAASRLPEAVGAEVVTTARAAFLKALRISAAISAAGSLALAVFAAAKLRRPPTGAGAAQPEPDARGPEAVAPVS